ncbi:MAG: AEC family transporter [Salaquimonas sp.]
MLPIFESLLPVFILIAIGAFLKFIKLIQDDQWIGLERISYYLFFPALLTNTLYKTDFGAIAASTSVLAFFSGLGLVMFLGFALKRPMQAAFDMSPASYSSVFQGFTRWNAFVALAIAQKMGGQPAVTIVALGIGAMAIPVNILNLTMVAKWGDRSANGSPEIGSVFWLVARNPLVVGTLFGLILNFTGFKLYEPIGGALQLLAQVSLPLGLILVGAGLRFKMPNRAIAAAVATTFLKLVIVPACFTVAAYLLGIRGTELIAIAISGSVPSAMNGYLVAKDLGGDATLYAAIVTLQVIVAFFTIPLVVLAATYLS